VFLAHKKKGSLVAPTIVLSEYGCLFLSKRAACFSARKLFCGTLFAEGGGPSELPRLSRLAFLVSRGVVILFVYQNTQCAGRFFGMGDTPFVKKTRLVRKVMTVQNCSMRRLPMRHALFTGVVRGSNICGPASSRGRAILLRVWMVRGVRSQNRR
jgi:hypothetical protein